MKPEVHYCKSWFRLKKTAIEPCDDTVARSRHVSGLPYTALIGSASKPACFVELLIDKRMIGVGFLDAMLREYLTYQFQKEADGKLFLSMVTHRDFLEGSDKVEEGTTYIFQPSGELVIRKEHFYPHKLEEAHSNFDPLRNYEAFPEFGEYLELIKLDR